MQMPHPHKKCVVYLMDVGRDEMHVAELPLVFACSRKQAGKVTHEAGLPTWSAAVQLILQSLVTQYHRGRPPACRCRPWQHADNELATGVGQ